MTNNDVANIIKIIMEDWPENSLEAELCSKFVTFISNKKLNQVSHLTYSSFIPIFEKKVGPEILLGIVRYLSGERVKVLETNFEFIDDCENTYLLSKEDISEILTQGKFFHPDTGEKISKPESNIFMYFSPGEKIRNMHNG